MIKSLTEKLFGSGKQSQAPHPFLLNSVPKCGTHLLIFTMTAMPRLKHGRFVLTETLSSKPGKKHDQATLNTIPEQLEEWVNQKTQPEDGTYEFDFAHLPYTPEIRQAMQRAGLKQLGILRDPRDQILSYTHAMVVDWMPESAVSLPFDERLKLAITGGKLDNGNELQSVAEQFQAFLDWENFPEMHVVTYEKLVGPKGGGDIAEQHRQIDALAKHIGLSLSKEEIAEVAEKAYGQPGTFRKGQIGSWREAFKPEHIKLMKEVSGELLIRLGYEKSLDW